MENIKLDVLLGFSVDNCEKHRARHLITFSADSCGKHIAYTGLSTIKHASAEVNKSVALTSSNRL